MKVLRAHAHIARELHHHFARLLVVNTHRAVLAARGERAAVAAHVQGVDLVFYLHHRCANGRARGAVNVSQRAIAAARQQHRRLGVRPPGGSAGVAGERGREGYGKGEGRPRTTAGTSQGAHHGMCAARPQPRQRQRRQPQSAAARQRRRGEPSPGRRPSPRPAAARGTHRPPRERRCPKNEPPWRPTAAREPRVRLARSAG